jgi:hypothetical protein
VTLSSLKKYCSTYVLLILFMHFPYWVCEYLIGFSIPLFSVELLFAPILLRINYRLLPIFYGFEVFLSGIFYFSALYNFDAPLDFLLASKFLTNVDLFRSGFFYLACGFILYIAAFYSLVKRHATTRINYLLPFFLVIIFVIADSFNGSIILFKKDARLFGVNIIGSPAFNLFKVTYDGRSKIKDDSIAFNNVSARINSETINWVGDNPRGKVVYILIESMGAPTDYGIKKYVTDRIINIASRYNHRIVKFFDEGLIVSKGSTTFGELRTLCGRSGRYQEIVSKNYNCLPNLLIDSGFSSIGVHGFSENMFSRPSWWPFVGISDSFFLEKMGHLKNSNCGSAFRGICDNNLISFAFDLAKNESSFLYILTLNSHLPFERQDVDPEFKAVCDKYGYRDLPCQILGMHINIMTHALELSFGLDGPVRLYMVGDHPPPFSNYVDRLNYMKRTVPYYIFNIDDR